MVNGQTHADTTALLGEVANGSAPAADRLLPLVYDELRSLAGRYLQRFPNAATLQPTALVHEAYLRLVGRPDHNFTGRAHFMAIAAKVMRGILVDHARRKNSVRRGGGWSRITLDDAAALSAEPEVDTLALDEVLTRLSEFDERKARVAEMRFFGGLSLEQVAEATGTARSTVAEDWRMARAWLARELLDGAASS